MIVSTHLNFRCQQQPRPSPLEEKRFLLEGGIGEKDTSVSPGGQQILPGCVPESPCFPETGLVTDENREGAMFANNPFVIEGMLGKTGSRCSLGLSCWPHVGIGSQLD